MKNRLAPHAAHFLVSLAVLFFGAGDAVAIGSGGPSNWADSNCAGQPVNGFHIRAGGRVDGLQFSYRDSGWAPNHGNAGGTPLTVVLDADETFTEVRYSAGSSVNQLTFVTSKGRVFGPYGGSGGTPGVVKFGPTGGSGVTSGVVKGSDGAGLSCMSGASGVSIDQLIFSWLPPIAKVSDKPKSSVQPPVLGSGMPEVSSVLKKMLAALPVPGIADELQKMALTLKNTSCGGGLKGCYSAKSGQLQLYFFTSGQAQQTLLLVIDRKLSAPMPKLLGEKLHKILADTELQSPIFSISTTDYQLDTSMMPPDLQKVVRESYFNVDSLSFASGVQLAARANLGGAIKATMQVMGVKSDQLTLRAAVVMPIPTDLASGIGAGAGMANAVLKEGDTMKKAGADAMKPEAFIEFQLAPGSSVSMNVPQMTLTDTTFFINQSLTFGYKGNAAFKTLPDKKILLQFQTPLDPAGAMDLLDFAFRMAMPQSFTLQDQAMMAIAMALNDEINFLVSSQVPFAAGKPETVALSKLGGGYIGNIAAVKKSLLLATKPLSVFQLRNPKPASPYKFGDRSKPFPTTDDPFNVMLLGPLADGGPLLYVSSEVRILGQTMGQIEVSVGKTGFHGTAEENLSLKLGPLGNTKIKMLAKADITGDVQNISLKGNLAGQNLLLALSGDTLTVEFSASCVNPFEIKTSVKIQESMDIGQIFEGQGGANVDPSKLQNCIGKDLEAAYNKIAGEYKSLSGYTANQASAALNKIASDATAATVKAAKEAQEAAAAEAARAKAAADLAYKQAKDAARNLANSSGSTAMKAFSDAGNFIKGFGKKKHKGGDNRFAPTVFDWDYYYDHNPELVSAGIDLADHWRNSGFAEGRRGSFEFDMTYFRSQHPGASDSNLLNYWVGTGIDRGDQSSPEFSLQALVRRYPGGSYRDNLNWWFEQGGADSGLNASP